MSDASFWDRRELSFKQLPTLQELFCACDKRLLAQTVMDEYVLSTASETALSPKRRRAMKKRIIATLEAMCSLPVKKKRNHARILLPEESFVLGARAGLIERKLSALLTTLDDVSAARYLVDVQTRDASSSAKHTEDVLPDEVVRLRPSGYALEKWKDTLVARVWLGGPWCCRERYLVLANAFWEMTYYGFEYDQALAGQVRAKMRAEFEAVLRGGAVKVACGSQDAPTTASECARQAAAFGLMPPNALASEFSDRMIECLEDLNDVARLNFWCCLLDVAHRLGIP